MDDNQILIGNELALQTFSESITLARKGIGSLIAIPGETGYGKSHLLQILYNKVLNRSEAVAAVHVECQQPVGNMNVGSLQPLLPFTRVIEKLLENKHVSPEKRFAMNMVMTTLASLPLAGDVFYAVKEMGKDYREFKKEKSSSKFQKVSSAAADYYDTLLSYTEKMPLVIFLDDMHFADAQSVELLSLLTENIASIPIVLVFSYKQSIIDRKASPLFTYIQKNQANKDNYHKFELTTFSRNQLNDACRKLIPDYISNSEFEGWLYDHSFGVPGILAEYIRYFRKYSPFNPDGSLATNFKDNEFLPATIQALFSQAIEKLNEEEKNILAVCSAEGKEFTATIVANLMNTDILTAIKKLRSLQNKTGIIKSIGANQRYGAKTTVYQFTQAFYHSFFENLLEYEEYVALHSQIAALLKQKYYETDDEETRRQIAPFLAAHSSVSGDKETAKSMLLATAQHSKMYGSADVSMNAYQSYLDIDKDKAEEETENVSDNEINTFRDIIHSQQIISGVTEASENDNGTNRESTNLPPEDFKSFRRRMVNEYHNGNYEDSAKSIADFLNLRENELTYSEQAQIILIAVKCFIEARKFALAEKEFEKAEKLVELADCYVTECFLLNVGALLHIEQSRFSEAYSLLVKAAEKSNALPPELKLIVLINIGEILKERSPEKAETYFKSAEVLSRELNFHNFCMN